MENKAKCSRDSDFLRILNGDFSKKLDGFEKPVGQITEPEAYRSEEDFGHQFGTSLKPHSKEASRSGENICERNKLKYSKAKPKSARQQRRQVNDASERKAARVSVSKNGVAFSITWRNSKHLFYYLTIPKEVATSMKLSNQEKVVIKDQENNSWVIELRVRPSRVDLAQGWRKFLYDKKIMVGDILTFEFYSNNLIHVNVERPTQADHPSHSASQCHSGFIDMSFKHVEPAVNYDGKHQTPEGSQDSESLCSKFRRSSFKITWRETTHGKFLIIPKSVAEEQKLVNNQSILLSGEGGKLWHMAVKINPIIGCFLMSRGWSEFWQGNGIAEGDTLNFEFISVGMVKVSITRASQTHDHTVRCNSGNSFAFITS